MWKTKKPGTNRCDFILTSGTVGAGLALSPLSYGTAIWTRDPENEVLDVCEELGIGFMPWSPLGMGYLTGRITPTFQFREGDIRKSANFPRFTDEAMYKNRPVLELLQKMGEKKCYCRTDRPCLAAR